MYVGRFRGHLLPRFFDGQTFLSFELVVSEEGVAGGIEGHVCTCLQ